MKSFPMFIDVAGRTVVVVGGGEQAAQKARLILKSEARLMLAADALDDELSQLVAAGRARVTPVAKLAEVLAGCRFAFIATGCAAADAAAAALAGSLGVLVNVVDRPELCDLTTPAIVDRDPVVVAIGTEGTAPVLARQVKTRIEEMLEPNLGDLAALAGRLRASAARRIPRAAHRAFWRWVFAGPPRRLFAAGREAEAAALVKAEIERGGEAASGRRKGFVSLVGAGPGSADLITLRGVQRLQEADVIFYDRLVAPEVLELARRDAERVCVGKRPGGAQWPQDRINGLVAAAARAGKRVVRLKCGDPLVFGRAGEEAAALDAVGVAWEIVPGVTAALAAAAEAKVFPTRRGETRQLTLATGHGAEGAAAPAYADQIRPGATTAFYMCVANAARMSADLIAAGAPRHLRVIIVENAETGRARRFETRLDGLADCVDVNAVRNPAILFVTWPLSDACKADEVEQRKLQRLTAA